jgi:hypothetical protein
MLRLSIVGLLALCLAAIAGNAIAQAPVTGTLTATVTETITTTKTVNCASITKDMTRTPAVYICTPTEPIPPDPGSGGGGTDPGTGLPAITCPSGSMVITGKWGESTIYTSDGPNAPFNQQWLAVEVKVPAGWSSNSIQTSSWVEYIDGAPTRSSMMATQPCTFDQRYALKTGNGQVMYTSNQIGFSHKYKTGDPAASAAVLTPGTTYWINAKNQYPDGSASCTGSCNMRGGLPD